MNICFIIGKIIEEIEFKFMLNGKNDSISRFKIELLNNTIIEIIAYNKTADYCYSKLKKVNMILIEGTLDTKLKIIAKNICVLEN